MSKYNVCGQVFLADGFDYTVEASNEHEAEKIAKRMARDADWSAAEIQEICLNGTTEISEPTPYVRKQYAMTLAGGLCGQIWWPNAACGLRINIDLSREIGRFTERPTLRELLDHVLMEHGGDFQSASFTGDTEIVVTSYTLATASRRKTMSRSWPITAFKSISDLVAAESFTHDFEPSEDPDDDDNETDNEES